MATPSTKSPQMEQFFETMYGRTTAIPVSYTHLTLPTKRIV